jgi:hypothetical protein
MRGERYGLWLLLASAGVGILFAVILAITPNAILNDPSFRVGSAPVALRYWGITWVGFSIFALVLILVPFRRGERWAWWTLWVVPLLWLAHWVAVPLALHNPFLAAIGALGLILTRRRFFAA